MTAWTELSEATRGEIRSLLDVTTPEQFAKTCTWADDVSIARPETAAWHFIHIPKDARAIDLARDCPPPVSCVVDQIERSAAVLDSKADKPLRADALKFLTHLVGDLHQPLNVAFAADGGGARINVVFLGNKTTMRALWEWGLLQVPASALAAAEPHTTIGGRSRRIHWREGGPRDWAQDTLWVMRSAPTAYVGNPGGLELGELYVQQNYPIAQDQLEKAGIRLALLLGRLLHPDRTPRAP